MFATSLFQAGYRTVLKPILFRFDPELVHNGFTAAGEALEKLPWLISSSFRFRHDSLHRHILGIDFPNPVGLAAGFDYDGHLAQIMPAVGFGYNAVGSVTYHPYAGNPAPRLARLPRSHSLLVNKGFKSSGARAIRARLDSKNLRSGVLGISVGSSNVPAISSVKLAINDYCQTFRLFKSRRYVKYFELNISCPNIRLKGAFTEPKNFAALCRAVTGLKIKQPLFVKMPNEITLAKSDELVAVALRFGIRGFIFSNLVKDRTNPALDLQEIASVSHLSGNFSGRPTSANSLKLIRHTRKKFGKEIAIIGTGGIFSAEDAKAKLNAGADLVQLITGMIYEGPQLIGQINKALLS